MALSEHEEALLQQMEEALYAEDPRFASRIEKTKSRRVGRGRVIIGVVAAVAGLALVVVSAMSRRTPQRGRSEARHLHGADGRALGEASPRPVVTLSVMGA